jgi:UDP-glucose 4-epimerase
MRIFVTGGAGYIGSIAVKKLIELEHDVIVADNLSKGVLEFVNKKAKFYKRDLIDKKELEKIFLENKIDAVMHFAGYKSVEESMTHPEKYSDNIVGTINLLELMTKYKVEKIIYSSSAAVYKESESGIVTEESMIEPANYYGFTKVVCENLIKWYSKAYNIKHVILRYFNVAGDGGLNYIDKNAQNVIPLIMEVITGKREKFLAYGNDYNTPDGTGVRDYIDINDLIAAHIRALKLEKSHTINLGTNKGISVKNLIDITEKVTGKKLNYEYVKRRKGDTGKLVTSNEKAKKLLSWQPQKSIEEMIKSTYDAYCKTL